MTPDQKLIATKASPLKRATRRYEFWAKWSIGIMKDLLQLSDSLDLYQREPINGYGGGTSQYGSFSTVNDESQTPEERLEHSHQHLRQTLAGELLNSTRQATPAVFEAIVRELLVAMRYGPVDDIRTVRATGDESIEGVVYQDGFGLDALYVRAKAWTNSVGHSVVKSFQRSLEEHRIYHGVLITTSTFTNDAREYVRKASSKIALIDGERLAKLMIDHEVGVTMRYRTRKIQTDFFEDGD